MARITIKSGGTRFMIVIQLSLVSILCFALMRGVLLIRAWPHIDNFSSDIPTRATFSEKISLVLISKAVP